MSRNGPIALAFHTLFVTFMLAPILVVCWVAFTPEGFLSFPTDNWSLRWFYAIARYPEFVSAFWRSLWLGALSSAIAVGISVPAALAIARYRFPGREAMTTLFMSPLMIPHIVLGIAFLLLTGSLATGLLVSEQFHGQWIRADHKTIFAGLHERFTFLRNCISSQRVRNIQA